MPYLNRNGVNIYYEERGSGPAVLLSHGYSASARMWKAQMDALSDRYHLIAWDMRGHDRSDSPDDPGLYSHETTVADMAAILDACGAKRAVIGGLSLGERAAIAWGSKYTRHKNLIARSLSNQPDLRPYHQSFGTPPYRH
jgi:pimeloyl-ACP methyl ester carboxylesterase